MRSGLKHDPGGAPAAIEPMDAGEERPSAAADGTVGRPATTTAWWRRMLAAWGGRREPFGRFETSDGWRCVFLRRLEGVPSWSRLAGVEMSAADWRGWLGEVLAGLEGTWPAVKADRSGRVAMGTLHAGDGRRIEVVAKRPTRTRWWQGGMDLIRPGRVRRTWLKTWALQARGIATEIPLLLAERRVGMAVKENVLVVERVPGVPLRALSLGSLEPAVRGELLRQIGATLALIDAMYWCHLDAKTHNWIVHESGGAARAVMIDCDGVRMYPAPAAGLRRLLTALARQEGFEPADARAVCDGYAPGDWPRAVRRAFELVENEKPTAG